MNAPAGSAPAGATGVAANYMNPYLQSVLTPQLDELRRQNDITNMKTNAGLTSQGAFGGGRQAIMNAENNRNLMMEQNKTVGQGYANAYDKAMGQYNTEQGQAKGLAELMAQQGASQRGIEQEGITADLNEFNAQRDYPQKMLQFQQSMLQGLPVQSVQNTAGSLSGLGTLLAGLGGGAAVASNLGYKDVGQLLKGFGLDLGPAP
jgi:nitrate reductase alpha subunit